VLKRLIDTLCFASGDPFSPAHRQTSALAMQVKTQQQLLVVALLLSASIFLQGCGDEEEAADAGGSCDKAGVKKCVDKVKETVEPGAAACDIWKNMAGCITPTSCCEMTKAEVLGPDGCEDDCAEPIKADFTVEDVKQVCPDGSLVSPCA